MPINQSHELYGAYKTQALPVRFEVLHGAGHGGRRFYDEYSTGIAVDFLDENVRSGSASHRPIPSIRIGLDSPTLHENTQTNGPFTDGHSADAKRLSSSLDRANHPQVPDPEEGQRARGELSLSP